MTTLFQSSGEERKSAPPVKKPEGVHEPTGAMKPLAAFIKEPDHLRFETQEEQEVVELFLRQHPIVNVPWIAAAIIFVFAPVVLFPVLTRILPLPQFPSSYLIIGIAFWYLATFGYTLSNFLHWFFNIYIVTNERLVDIDFLYLLYKRFSEAELVKIQDISFTSGGLLATIFDFGSVSIETAGEAPNLIFEKVPHPEQVVETIRSLTEIEKRESV